MEESTGGYVPKSVRLINQAYEVLRFHHYAYKRINSVKCHRKLHSLLIGYKLNQ